MSLKTFHLVFITLCVLLALGLATWALAAFASNGRTADLLSGLGWLVAGAALAVYERSVVKKLKHISYL
jgi:hypothetical protein